MNYIQASYIHNKFSRIKYPCDSAIFVGGAGRKYWTANYHCGWIHLFSKSDANGPIGWANFLFADGHTESIYRGEPTPTQSFPNFRKRFGGNYAQIK